MRLLLRAGIAALLVAISANTAIFLLDSKGSFPSVGQLLAVVIMYLSEGLAAVLLPMWALLAAYRFLKRKHDEQAAEDDQAHI
jgi:hypothetical protein